MNGKPDVLWRRKREIDLDRELRSHYDLEAEEQGDPYAARRTFGNLTRVKEDVRAAWGWTWLEQLGRDVRLALRSMRRRPVFTAVAVLSLAVGIGANTAIFSFAEAILIRKLPVRAPERLVILRQQNTAFKMENCCFTYSVFQRLREKDDDFEDVTALSTNFGDEVFFSENGQSERLLAEFVAGNYFRMLEVHAVAGRLIDEEDDRTEGASPVVVISYRLWQERFAGRADAVGRRVLINEQPFQIIGVTQPGFTGFNLHQPHDLEIPSSMSSSVTKQPRARGSSISVIARLKPGINLEQARAKLDAIGKRIQRDLGQTVNDRDDFILSDGSQGLSRIKEQFSRPVSVLLLLVGVVLIVACANLTALLLVRSMEGARETGMRAALGAPRLSLLRHSFAESLTLAVLGGAAGWGVTLILIQTLSNMLRPQNAKLVESVTPNFVVLLFAVGLTFATAVLFGALPAWRAMRADPLASIHGVANRPRRRPLLSRLIISGQVALSLALLFCAGLFSRTLANLRSMDLGFRPENLIVVQPDLRETTYAKRGGGAGFFSELLRHAQDLPGVSSATTTSYGVLSGGFSRVMIQVPGYLPPAGNVRPTAIFTNIERGYFRTLGIPLLAGREFTAEDRQGEVTPAIVNQQFAREFMGGDAVGKSFLFPAGEKFVIVGVVGTTKFWQLREDSQPIIYLQPDSLPSGFLYVRASGDPRETIERLRSEVAAIDPHVRLERISTMEEQVEDLLARERLLAFLSELLGGVAVGLSAIGLYGVLAFSVTRRTREIGIRVAVGAERRRIHLMFLRESFWTLLAGIVLGIPLAFGAGRLSSSLLYGLKPEDPSLTAGAIVLLTLISIAAALLPARRASRIDPTMALRHE
jgi:predicted permease